MADRKQKMPLSKDIRRKYQIIAALATLEKPSVQDIHRATKIPESTIKRQLGLIRKDFAMQILFVRLHTGERGAKGYYMLTDWGVLDRNTFLRYFGQLCPA